MFYLVSMDIIRGCLKVALKKKKEEEKLLKYNSRNTIGLNVTLHNVEVQELCLPGNFLA